MYPLQDFTVGWIEATQVAHGENELSSHPSSVAQKHRRGENNAAGRVLAGVVNVTIRTNSGVRDAHPVFVSSTLTDT